MEVVEVEVVKVVVLVEFLTVVEVMVDIEMEEVLVGGSWTHFWWWAGLEEPTRRQSRTFPPGVT